MENKSKLTLFKTLHTLVWSFFNVVVFYMLFAAITNKLDLWLLICYGLVICEGITLLIFKAICPLTILAHNCSNSAVGNFGYFPSQLVGKIYKIDLYEPGNSYPVYNTISVIKKKQ